MHPVLLLTIYSALCVVASLSGGWIPLFVRLTHQRMQIAISFVSGMMLGIALLHLLPHSLAISGSIDATVGWSLAGFLFMFFLQRFFHFHHHEAPDDSLLNDEGTVDHVASEVVCDHDHDHAHHHDHQHAHGPSTFSWAGAAVGLTLHGLVDGLALAAAVWAESEHGELGWAGLGAFLAIALHKPFDSLTIGTLMAAAGRPVAARRRFNTLYALVSPLGVVLFSLLLRSGGHDSPMVGPMLGFAAGAFLCIAASDLLPEVQFHSHDRAALSTALLAGIALAWSTGFLEAGHNHSPAPATSPHEASDGHDHSGHDHSGHDHSGHDHSGHGHSGHDHSLHDHSTHGHDHAHEHDHDEPAHAPAAHSSP